MKNGIYELYYRAASSPGGSYHTMLLVLRDGHVLGADTWGGVCHGRLTFNPGTRRYRVDLRLQVPPGGMLITDQSPRPDGELVEVGAEIDPGLPDDPALVDLGQGKVDIQLRFKGPLLA